MAYYRAFMFYLRRRRQIAASGVTPHPGNDILLESGDFLLLEDGSSTILLEV